MKAIYTFFILFFLFGCSDNATVNIFDKKITQSKIQCIKLVVFPPDKLLESELKKLYKFQNSCELKLEASQKSGITCNSNQNVQKKALSNFPSSYLKLQLSNKNLLYSYYIDLDHKVTKNDIIKAFKRIKKDLKL